MRRVLLLSLLLIPSLGHATDKARIAVIGDLHSLTVGQEGYCGSRTAVDRQAWRGIFVGGGAKTWLGIKASMRTSEMQMDCAGEVSFTPQAGNSYIVRSSALADRCVFELFRVVPGADPVKESLTREEPQVCLNQ